MRLLNGLLAIDLTGLEGQLCGKLLRDLGFDVIKIESPRGDPVRRLGPYKDDKPHLEGSLRFAYLNAGKKSVTLDIEQPDGWALLLQLVEQADVVLESGPPGKLDREALRARNEGLLITSVSGFGQNGPHAGYSCPDIVGLAMGGLMSISGDPSLPPVKPPETQGYYFACVYAALATTLALWQRAKDGRGQSIDISIQEAIASQEHLVRAYGLNGESIARHGSQHEHVAPANIFPASDGYVYLFVTRAHWRLLLDLWEEHPRELDEPRWLDNDYRRAHADYLNEMLSRYTSQFRRDDLTSIMQQRGVPCLSVNTPRTFLQDEHISARRALTCAEHPLLGTYAQVSFPLLLDGQRQQTAPPPLLGQHTREVLLDGLGVSPDEYELLFSQGTV